MSEKPTPTDRLYAIVEQGLCIGCGICQSIAGEDKVKVCKTSRGYLQPVVVGDIDHKTVDHIYEVCPGTRIEGLPEQLVESDTKIDNVWGPWRRMVRAWASDANTRYEGATGGVLTALACYLLNTNRVDFILHAHASQSEPSFGEATISTTREEVIAAAGSRYGPTATLIDIHRILDRGQTLAIVGTPCDLTALRNQAQHDSRINTQVKYWLTMVCGGFGPTEFTHDFYRRSGFEPDDVTALRYRGRGCPGPTRIEAGERATEVHYLDYWGDDESAWQLPFRCKICADGIGEAADVAASDTWPGGSPTREGSDDDPGINGVIARTVAGQELLEAALADGALAMDFDITPDDMSVYQPHQMRKKYAVWPRYQGLGDEGRIVPQTARLRIRELAEEMPEHVNENQRRGTRQRISVGKATEPTPTKHE